MYGFRHAWHLGTRAMLDRKLVYISSDEIHAHWEAVKAGLQRIKSKTREHWLVEDIYHQLKLGNCGLYVFDGGFVILQLLNGWDGKEMNVFCAYGSGNMDWALPQTKEIAKAAGCKRLKFTSTRDGWEKRAIAVGYTKGHTEYEMELI